MLVSSTILQNSLYKYKKNKENYGNESSNGANAAFDIAVVIIATIFFVLEFLVLFYAINIALKCYKGRELIVHLVLSTTFTLPYMLLTVFLKKDTSCSSIYLHENVGGFL